MRLIDGDSLIERVRYHADDAMHMCFPNVYNGILIACGEIDHAPTIDAELVRHGRWKKEAFLMGTTYRCNLCGENYGMPHGIFDFCPNCGAKMMDEVSE